MWVWLTLLGAGGVMLYRKIRGGFMATSAEAGELIGQATALGMKVIRGVNGYTNGQARVIDLAEIAPGKLLEIEAAIQFKRMQAAARQAGHELIVNSAFRDMETQRRLWAERMNADGTPNAVGKQKGVAARPGYSNHQSGIALDIDVEEGGIRPVYWWLVENAHLFGWRRTVRSENWHFDYRRDWTGHKYVSTADLHNPN